MKCAFAMLLAAACIAGVFLLSGRGSSARMLPVFDSAVFTPLSPAKGGPITLGPGKVRELEKIFGGLKKTGNPRKWAIAGRMELFKAGRPVLDMEVFSDPGGAGPVKIRGEYYEGYDERHFRRTVGSP